MRSRLVEAHWSFMDWDADGMIARGPRLIIGYARPGLTASREALRAQHERYFADQDGLIARGPLLSDDGNEWLGTAMLVELTDRAAVEAMMADEPGCTPQWRSTTGSSAGDGSSSGSHF